MPMILVKKNPRGKVIRELSSEEETAVKTVCGLKRPATMAQHNLANDLLREMREYDAWLQCDCIPGDSPAMNFAALKNNTGTLYLSSFNHEHAPECPMYRQLSGNEEETSFGASRHPVSTRINYRNFLPPDDSNSVIRLQARSAYHNGERSSVRKKRPRLGRLLLSLIEDAGLNKLDSLANPRIRTNYRECLDAIRQVTLQQEYIRGRALSEIIHFRPGMSERSQERLMETLENSERHWPARRKHMFFQILWRSTSVVMLWKFTGRTVIFRSSDLCGGSVLMVKRRAEYVPLTGLFLLFAGVPMAESSAVKGMLMLFIN